MLVDTWLREAAPELCGCFNAANKSRRDLMARSEAFKLKIRNAPNEEGNKADCSVEVIDFLVFNKIQPVWVLLTRS